MDKQAILDDFAVFLRENNLFVKSVYRRKADYLRNGWDAWVLKKEYLGEGDFVSGVEIERGRFLTSSPRAYSCPTSEDAILQIAKELSGELLVINAMGDNRREIRVPNFGTGMEDVIFPPLEK